MLQPSFIQRAELGSSQADMVENYINELHDKLRKQTLKIIGSIHDEIKDRHPDMTFEEIEEYYLRVDDTDTVWDLGYIQGQKDLLRNLKTIC